jgi:glycosyltransferase involved in cell wall biosynthesis
MSEKTLPRHVAVYMHTLYNGGVERVMFNLIQGFLERGIRVDLVLDYLEYSPFEKLLPPGTRLLPLGAKSTQKRLPRFIAYLKREKPDAVLSATHFANEVACLAKVAARCSRGPRTRLVLSEHTNLSADIRDSAGRVRPRILAATTRWIYPLADAVVAVSDGVAEDMCRVSGLARKRVTTVYNPIDFAGLERAAAEDVDEPWFAAGEPPVLVGIGRLEVQKNFPNMLRALKIVRDRVPARLILLGEGSERPHLAALCAEMGLSEVVKMPGFVSNPAAYMARAGVFAMSSSWEGMPVALIEGLALNTPVVSTDCPSGPTEVLHGGMYGELVPMDDSAALAAAIVKVLGGERKVADADWLARFDARTIVEQYLGLMSR